ncbi:hypothetical protein ACPDHQ_16060 [Myroides odoratimimus]|uniref:hypothetical protein n=2 Tax=Myroides odoratimimus TaxID=76832 RepID=UPI002DBDEF40|nr:hypothetical protein [Myroides odoratimimus]MEC4009245.1 hypothetical protein [Myroides odoratimimus]MEC4084609.1 hypothetical protein [Myroides odoratimimus]
MQYRINLNNNYPNAKHGLFSCKEHPLYYVFFMKPDPLHLTIRLDFSDFEAIAQKWDCIPTDKANIYLVNHKVIELLRLHYEGAFELLDVSVYSDTILIETTYKLVHVLNHVAQDKIRYNDDIWVLKDFITAYKKNRLKGWVFSCEDS